jgi:F-type H+-transporting ATPase subunit alpha
MKADSPSSTPLARQQQWLDDYRFSLRVRERGTVIAVGDGIAQVAGLPGAAMDDVLYFEDGSRGVVFDLEPSAYRRGAAEGHRLADAGTWVHRTGAKPSGSPSATSCSAASSIRWARRWTAARRCARRSGQPLEAPAPPIIARDFVRTPLYTGLKIIDTLIPIGKGQRQLLLGDDGLGRSRWRSTPW